MERNRSSFQVHQATEIVPGVILGGLRDLDDMLAMKPDVLVPLDRLPGYIWEDGYRGEILYMPIVDQSILPESVLEFFIDQLLERICEKRRIAIFCIGGHGRTGYIASCLLYRLGIRDPITYIRKNYSMKAVETDEQEDAVQAYCREHQPGFEKENVAAELKDGVLKVSAKTSTENEENTGTFLRRERFTGQCSRQFYVGEDIEEADIKAKFDNGTLQIVVPKKVEQPKLEESRTIAIEG